MSAVQYLYCLDNPLRYIDPLGLEIATVNINGNKLTVDTSKEQDVLAMLRLYDRNARGIAFDSKNVMAYDYATKKDKKIEFGLHISIANILSSVGIKNASSGVAYFSKIKCEKTNRVEYTVTAMNNLWHKHGLVNERILDHPAFDIITNGDYIFAAELAQGIANGESVLFVLYLYKTYSMEQAEKVLVNDFGWNRSGATFTSLYYSLAQKGILAADFLGQEDLRKQTENIVQLLALVGDSILSGDNSPEVQNDGLGLEQSDAPANSIAGGNKLNEISQTKLQHEFKHATDFGVNGTWNKTNGELFSKAIENHVNNVSTPIAGTYRGTINVNHYYNSVTGVNVMVDLGGNFVGGWKLSTP